VRESKERKTQIINCIYKCPCGANDKGGSNYPEGICSRAADMDKALDILENTYKKLEEILNENSKD